MEVVIGFVAGYLVGTRQGRKGMQEALESAQAIWTSPETRRLLGEVLSGAEALAGPVMERAGGRRGARRVALIGSVVDELIERRSRRAA